MRGFRGNAEFEMVDVTTFKHKEDHEYYGMVKIAEMADDGTTEMKWILALALMEHCAETTDRLLEFLDRPEEKEHVARFHPTFTQVLVPVKFLYEDGMFAGESTPVVRALITGVDPDATAVKNVQIVDMLNTTARTKGERTLTAAKSVPLSMGTQMCRSCV